MEEGMFYANKFLTAGADGIEVMGGSWKPVPDIDDIPSTADKPGRMLGLSAVVRKAVLSMPGEKKNPVFIGGGRTYLPSLAEEALAEGKCDFIFMGHGLLAEPHLVEYMEQDRCGERAPASDAICVPMTSFPITAISAAPATRCLETGKMTTRWNRRQ